MIRNLEKLPLILWVPLRKKALSLVADDCGTNPLDAKTRHNLHWFRLDGVFAQASESIILAYLSLFVLALGASRGQIGLMSALATVRIAPVLR